MTTSNHLKILEQWLKHRRSSTEPAETGFPFVTIARETGAGSRQLCDTLMGDFRREPDDLFRGWHVFDRLICEALANDPVLSGALEDLVKERYESEFQDLMDDLIAGRDGCYLVYRKSFHLIAMLAAIGKVIIVGRAACCVTARMRTGVHVRLVAPAAYRAAVIAKREKLDPDEARDLMLCRDKERRKLVKSFFNRDIADPMLYDAVWNTERVPMAEISASIIRLVKQRATAGEE
jgi:hypothetical protein